MAGYAGAGAFPLPSVAAPMLFTTRSARSRARFNFSSSITTIANDAISALNSLAFSYRPPRTPSPQPPPSTLQQRLVARIYSNASRFVRRRTASSVVTSDDSVAALHLQHHSDAAASYSSSVAAVPLVANRVALPSSAGAVDMLDVLPPSIAAVYRQPATCLATTSQRPSRVVPRVFAAAGEYGKLVRRMTAHGMLTFTTQPLVINGLFGVAKPDGSIRLIVDGRPANAIFAEPPHVDLPTPDLLPRLQVAPNTTMYVAKSDLADFFYRFRVPAWMHRYFALPGLTAGDAGVGAQYGAATTVYPCVTVLAMGWSHSVYITQVAHLHLCDTSTRLLACDRITSSSDLLVNRTRHLVYIDDVVMVGLDPDDMAARQREYLAVADARGLPAKPSKVVAPTPHGVDCLGLELVGTDCVSAPRADKPHRLRMDTIALARRHTCTGRELAAVVGRWTWFMLVSRSALACFSSVYRFALCADRNRWVMWASVRRELLHAVAIGPLLTASLSSNWCGHIVATDASTDGLGVVAAEAPQQLVVVAARAAGSLVAKDAAATALDQSLVTRPWTTWVATRWRAPEHINSLELRAISTGVRRVLSSPLTIGRRLLLLCDSQVAVGALAKGRSSARTILLRLRPLTALLLSSGLLLYPRWVASALNPADGPSRRYC